MKTVIHKKRKKLKKVKRTAALCAAAMLLGFMSPSLSDTAFAGNTRDYDIDMSAKGSITVTAETNAWYTDGTTFRLYRVATLNEDNTFTRTSRFSDDKLNIPPNLDEAENLRSSQMMERAKALSDYIRKNGLREDASADIKDKKLTFTDLPQGLYVVDSSQTAYKARKLVYQPLFICIPQRGSTAAPWIYDVVSKVKSANLNESDVPTPSPQPSKEPSGTPSEKPESNESTESGKENHPETTSSTSSEKSTPIPSPSIPDDPGSKGNGTNGGTGHKTGGTTPQDLKPAQQNPNKGKASQAGAVSSLKKTTSRSVPTGDNMMAYRYVGLLILSGAVLMAVKIYRAEKGRYPRKAQRKEGHE